MCSARDSAHAWLTADIAAMADRFLLLKRQQKANLGNPQVRDAWREARNGLRLAIARRVYTDHQRWDNSMRSRELFKRERLALAQAELRFDGEPGDVS